MTSSPSVRARWGPPEVYLMTAGIVLQFMSGHSANYFLPVPIDRPLVLAGVLLACYRLSRSAWRPTLAHFVMSAFLGWVLISMIWSGSISSPGAIFAWLDAVGLIPFLIFLTAPIIFDTPARRRVLLGGLTLLGAYLGVIALLEGLGWYHLVWPSYIYNPDSSHFGRAGGPARQVASNGLQLMGCALAAAAFAHGARGRRIAVPAWTVSGLCLMGTFFTMTRSIWLGVLAGVVAALMVNRRSAAAMLMGAAALTLALIVAVATQPALRDMLDARLSDSRSAFDRINANDAAVDIILARPLQGIGFQQFASSQADWLWQSADVPVTSTGIAVHNVVLGYAAELGLPGAALWLACLLLPVIYLWRSPSVESDHGVLRRVALAYTICWFVVGMLVPMTYALPSTMLWLFLALPTEPSRLGFPADRTRSTQVGASS